MKIENDAQLSNVKGFISNLFLSSDFELKQTSNCFVLYLSPSVSYIGEDTISKLNRFGFVFKSTYINTSDNKLVAVFKMPC